MVQQTNFMRRTIVLPWYFIISLLMAIASFPETSLAQIPSFTNFAKKNIRLSGQASLYGELYDVQGTARRRPPNTQRFSCTPTLTFANLFSVSADFMLSSEGTYSRQNMNIMGLHPAWKWGKAHLGDYSDFFSNTTFNGVNVKGAEIDLYPGKFRFTIGGGQTQRAVDGNVIDQNYAQYLYSSRIGYGRPNGSFLDLIIVKAKDDISSLKKLENVQIPQVLPDTLNAELDTLWVEPPYNPYAVTPQENLVMGFNGRLQLLQNKIIIKMEGSGSAYTKNLQTATVDIDSVDMPDFLRAPLKNVFTPHRSSNLDFALYTDLELNFKDFKTEMGYRTIGPGYISLGIPSAVNDRREYLFNTMVRLGIHRLQFNWNRLADNLLKQKQVTNIRNQFGFGINTNTRVWQSNVQIQFLSMTNKTPADTLQYDFSNLIVNVHESIALGKEAVLKRLGIQYTLQTSDKATLAKTDKAQYHTVNLTAQVQPMRNIRANASAGLSFRKSGQENSTTNVYSIRLTHMALKNKLSNSFFSSVSMIRNTRVFRIGCTSSYQLTQRNQLVFDLTQNVFRGARDFHETRTSLSLRHRF